MIEPDRITIDPMMLGGMPCIRGLPVTVSAILELITNGKTSDEILAEYPYLTKEDLVAAISFDERVKQSANCSHSEPERKLRPNHQRTLRILRAMTPQQKLAQVFKLNERTLQLFRVGLRQRFPDLDDAQLEYIYLQMRERCHNRNY